jgi:hypothetical protein
MMSPKFHKKKKGCSSNPSTGMWLLKFDSLSSLATRMEYQAETATKAKLPTTSYDIGQQARSWHRD